MAMRHSSVVERPPKPYDGGGGGLQGGVTRGSFICIIPQTG